MSETTTEEKPAETTEQKPASESKTFTQEDVNALLAKQKREQFGDYGDLKKKAAAFDELETAKQTDQERATAALTAAEQRATEAEAKALRLEVAAEKGLTTAQAKRLVGTTRDELEADADELLETFKPAEQQETKPPTVDLDLGTRTTGVTSPSGDPRAADIAQIEADLKASKRQ